MGRMVGSEGERRVKVVCVTPVGPDGMGGIDRLYFYMRDYLAASGVAPAVDIRYFAARGPSAGNRWLLAFPLRVLAFLWLLITEPVDVVHLNHSTHGSALRKWLLASLAKLFGKVVSCHFHGLVSDADYAANPAWLGLYRALLAKADRIVILGDFFAADLTRRFGVPLEKMVVIPNGIPDFAADLPAPKPAKDAPLILFAGEVGPRKGAGLLLEALANLRQKGPRWRCIIAGNGDIPEYRAMAQMLGLKDRVSFTGWVDADRMHALMREADIVVLPSRIEALPLSLIEGACAGAALVASNAGASAEIAREGRNGVIVPLESEAIAEALADLIAHPEHLAAMQVESRAVFLEHFRIDQFESAMTAFFLGVARRDATVPAPLSAG